MFSIPQSTSFVLVFKAYLSSDHVTEATGKTIAITISKAGGAFGNPNAGATNATEISSGWYKVTLDTTDTATLGVLAIRGAVATIDDYGDRLFVVSATTGGLTNLDATVSSVFSRLGAPAGASISADVAAVKSDTGTILNDVNTGAGAIYTRIGAPAGASIAADIAAVKAVDDAVKAKTDNIPASPAAVGSAMTLTGAYDFAKGTVAMTESYAANGAAPTPVQAVFAIHQYLMGFTISGTSYTTKKLDNSTTAYVVTLDSATVPTAASRT